MHHLTEKEIGEMIVAGSIIGTNVTKILAIMTIGAPTAMDGAMDTLTVGRE